MTTPDIIRAHRHSRNHREELRASEQCGCFYCAAIFHPDEIAAWTTASAALCPNCGVDSVIGSESGYPITPEFLDAMCTHWFSTADEWTDPPPAIGVPPARDDTICEHYSPERCGCMCEGDDNMIVHHADGTSVPASQSLLGLVLGTAPKPKKPE